MRPRPKFAMMLTVLAGLVLPVGVASGAGETATNGFQMSPLDGGLYKEVPKPITWRVEVEIKAPYPASPQVLPMKRVTATFPTEMSFNPDPKMPECADDKIGPDVNLSISPDEAVSRCPDSVIGNGSSELYLARLNGATGPNLKDPVLIVFNGGRTVAGLPKMKIYGYSKNVGTGIYMEGVLKDGILDVSIPVLPYDSAVGSFNLNIPGSDSPFENRRGQTRNYVQTTCKDGQWHGGSEFVLGTRDEAGQPTSADFQISAPPLAIPCEGAVGSPRFKLKAAGGKTAKRGTKVTYKVTVTNSGTATARKVSLAASGKGVSGRTRLVGIAPGRSKSVKVKVRLAKAGNLKVRFRAGGVPSGSGSVVKRIKVR